VTRVRLSAPSVLYIVSSWGPAREATHSVRSSPFSSLQSEFSHVLSQNTTAFFLHPSPPYSAILWSNFHTAYRDAARHIRLVTSNKREHNDFDLKCYRQDVWNLFLAALCGRDKNKVITGGLNSPIPHVRPSVRPSASYATITPLLLHVHILGSNVGLQFGESEGFCCLCHCTSLNTGMAL